MNALFEKGFHHWKAQSFSFIYKYFALGVSQGLQVDGKSQKCPRQWEQERRYAAGRAQNEICRIY